MRRLEFIVKVFLTIETFFCTNCSLQCYLYICHQMNDSAIWRKVSLQQFIEQSAWHGAIVLSRIFSPIALSSM